MQESGNIVWIPPPLRPSGQWSTGDTGVSLDTKPFLRFLPVEAGLMWPWSPDLPTFWVLGSQTGAIRTRFSFFPPFDGWTRKRDKGKWHYVNTQKLFPVVFVYVKVLVYIIFKLPKQPASEALYSNSFMSRQHRGTWPSATTELQNRMLSCTALRYGGWDPSLAGKPERTQVQSGSFLGWGTPNRRKGTKLSEGNEYWLKKTSQPLPFPRGWTRGWETQWHPSLLSKQQGFTQSRGQGSLRARLFQNPYFTGCGKCLREKGLEVWHGWAWEGSREVSPVTVCSLWFTQGRDIIIN